MKMFDDVYMLQLLSLKTLPARLSFFIPLLLDFWTFLEQ